MRSEMRFAVAMAAATVAGSPARADELQNQLLAGAKTVSPDSYAFRRTIILDRTGEARKTFVEQFDPKRQGVDRWSLASVDGRAPTPKESADSRKSKRGPVPSYAELAKWLGAPATRSDTGPGYALYRYARLPAGTLKIGSHDASPDTQAEILVNLKGKVPFVERVRMHSTKGFRMMLIASIDSITADQRYRLLPDGHAVPSDFTSDMSGSLMGKAGRIQASATYTDFQAVR